MTAQAEKLRATGKYRQAIERALPSLIPTADIPKTAPETLHGHMANWRIITTSHTSLANQTLNGDLAAEHLLVAKGVVRDYYYHPHTQEQATLPMKAEQRRDEARYNVAVAALTGNAGFLERAVISLDEAITFATEGTSAQALAIMEREQLRRRLGGFLNFDTFAAAYDTVVTLGLDAGSWDRVATASTIFAGEALQAGRLKEVAQGMEILFEAASFGHLDPKRYVVKGVTRPLINPVRKATYTHPRSDTVFEISSQTS